MNDVRQIQERDDREGQVRALEEIKHEEPDLVIMKQCDGHELWLKEIVQLQNKNGGCYVMFTKMTESQKRAAPKLG